MRLELAHHSVGAVLGSAEHEGLPVALDDLCGDGDPLGALDLPEVVGDVGLGLRGRLDGEPHGVPLVRADDRLHLPPDGGREEHDLAVGRRLVEQAAHCGQEPHVGHAVGLVEDHGGHVVEADVSPCDEVLQAARARHHNVDALVQGAHLVAVPRPAEDRHDALAGGPEQVDQDRVHLRGQLACGHEDQRPGTARQGLLGPQGERDGEGERLPRAGGCPPADVAAGQGRRDGSGLNGERLGDAQAGEPLAERRGDAKVGEGSDDETPVE